MRSTNSRRAAREVERTGRFEIDDRLTERALRVDARASTRGDVLAADLSGTTYPRYVARSQGAYVWDVDGNRYIDYLLGYGPVVLGHAHPAVLEAVTRQLERGHCVAPLWSPEQVGLLELLCEVIPGAEAGLLLKTGSDATSAAVRLSRIFTGREVVVRAGYNGWHDWSVEQRAGVPNAVREHTSVFALDDLASLAQALHERAGEVACVVTVPFEDDVLPPGHLAEVRRLAHAHGALLVLDEMRSGFRVGLGGAQEMLSVQADLATFSKAMANGFPISAVLGRADVLAGLAQTKISSTFFANPAEMAAARTTIEQLRDTDALTTIWRLGHRLQTGLRELIAAAGLPAEVVGHPPMPFMRFTATDSATRNAMTHAFFAATTRQGVLFHPAHQWFLSAAHTDDDIDSTLEVCAISMGAAMEDLDRLR